MSELTIVDPSHQMAVLDRTGDKKTVWDASKPEEVEAVREEFDRLTAKGWTAFRVKKDGGKGEKITKFDPEAEAIIMVPRIVGG